MDQKRLFALIDEQRGFTRVLTRKGHYTVRRHGQLVTTLPKTPSDSRSTANALSQLKKAGLKVPR